MKKIAIIGNGFTGATLPLAKEWSKMGYEIDCYYLVRKQRKIQSIESLNFENEKLKIGHIHKIDEQNSIFSYLDSTLVTIFLLPFLNRKRKLEKLQIGEIIKIINNIIIKKYAIFIKHKHYDYINLIIHSEIECQIYNLIKDSAKVILSLHEVLIDHTSSTTHLKKEALFALSTGCDIILHSEKSKQDLIGKLNSSLSSNIYKFYFGSFDSYTSYKGELSQLISETNYVLFLGYIHPYKGLSVLYEAINHLKNVFSAIKVVVAGKGYDPILKEIKKDSSFILINRFIENDELVSLIKLSRVVVCPYISASQSGIVQTAAVFQKPVIATNTGAFPEIIKNNENGFIVKANDPISLSNMIYSVYVNDNLYNSVVTKLGNSNIFKWNKIASDYINLFNSIL
jgi:glycosyltransferase involved in cell wall biosynthesis